MICGLNSTTRLRLKRQSTKTWFDCFAHVVDIVHDPVDIDSKLVSSHVLISCPILHNRNAGLFVSHINNVWGLVIMRLKWKQFNTETDEALIEVIVINYYLKTLNTYFWLLIKIWQIELEVENRTDEPQWYGHQWTHRFSFNGVFNSLTINDVFNIFVSHSNMRRQMNGHMNVSASLTFVFNANLLQRSFTLCIVSKSK